jgi:hypothetical protein
MSKLSIKVVGVSETFKSVDEELVETVNSLARLQGLDTVNELKEKTPVDTGRARNSWLLTSDKNKFIDGQGGYPSFGMEPMGPPSKKKIETLYITNGVPYIRTSTGVPLNKHLPDL